jgi:ABC-type nickel/cobalt efflux system permease component RcnA
MRCFAVFLFALCASALVAAHPLGQLSINHFARITSGADRVAMRYVVDLAELPTYQESQTIDADSNGGISKQELNAYLDRVAPEYAANLHLTADGERIDLQLRDKSIDLLAGSGGSASMGLATLRLVFDLEGNWPQSNATVKWRFEDRNQIDRPGWRELVVVPNGGATIFDSTAFGGGVTDELKAYPEEMLDAPPSERIGEWSVTRGALPANAKPLTMRDGKPAVAARDRFAELIAAPRLTPGVILLGLLLAFALGGMHAMSPGHGKTIVGAYLVGSRGTARHAAFLGLTVTITHTAVVFAVGLAALFASNYILPETLYPVLSFASGALVVVIGLSLFVKRLRVLLGVAAHEQEHLHHDRHGDGKHAHLPPVASGEALTWRSLLALGVSGGLLPCPSALVVMLAAISLNRVGYGLALIVVFSLGLASVLTAVGLAFVYAGKLVEAAPRASRLLGVLPAVSAFIIAALGAAICYQALRQGGVNLAELWSADPESMSQISIVVVLTIGLFAGLQHALDADHLAAVSTIVSERKNLFSSLLVGGVWGVGHTVSLLLAGVAVILLRVRVDKYEKQLEFCVALMLIALGANVLYKLARGGRLHFHEHRHASRTHLHPHLHGDAPEPAQSHHGLKLGVRPLIIGMVHGLAGSAALILVVLAKLKSIPLQFACIAVFGIGSIGGMMAMSLILSLPLRLTADHFTRTNWVVRALAGVFSLGLGLFMVYEIGIVEGLLR